MRAAASGFHRQRARAATGVEDAGALQILWQPIQQRAAHVVASGANRGADAVDRRI